MSTRPDRSAERVVLLSDDAVAVGTAAKATVHHAATPLHLAFSCYLLDGHGRLLVTRRAVAKRTWPGVWTNSCCGHPAPGEPVESAVRRRVQEELGMTLGAVECLLPDFRYRAVDASGVVENEVCPVYIARLDDAQLAADPDPAEVAEWRWVAWEGFVRLARDTPWAISPWAALQTPLLAPILAAGPADDLAPQDDGSPLSRTVGGPEPELAGRLQPERAGDLQPERAGDDEPERAGGPQPERMGGFDPEQGRSFESRVERMTD